MKLLFITFFVFFINALNAQDNIFDASRKGDVKQIEEILTEDPNLANSKDEMGYTPLILAAYRNQLETVKILLKYGAKVDEGFGQGTALHGACYKGFFDIAKFLVENNADVNSTDANGTTPIKYSTLSKNVEISTLLFNNGADVNHKDNTGNSALDYAEQLEIKELIEIYNSNKSK